MLAADTEVVELADADVVLLTSSVVDGVVCTPMLVLVVVEIADDFESVIVMVVTVVTEMLAELAEEDADGVGFQPVYCPESYVRVDAHVVRAGVC